MKKGFIASLLLIFIASLTFAQHIKPKRQLIKNGNDQIEVFVYGQGDVSLILAAGNGRPAAQLEELATAIAANGIQVITYNYRTLGASTGVIENITLHDYANDLMAIVTNLKLTNVYLGGKTYGNRVVRTFSQDYPDIVKGIILIGAGGEVSPSKETIELYQRYMDPNISKEEWMRLQGVLMYAPGNEYLAKIDAEQGEFPILAGEQAKASDRTPKAEWSMGGVAPMLILTCLEDRVALPESALSIAKKRPKTWLIGLPNCGHNMLNERGDDIKELVVNFLKKTPSEEVRAAKP
ncbi:MULTISPECIES: alpha/beta fold hydrolase [Sphingobacterium]|uniref:alpha/beta fold hydrolase n=1 Tax=Sphingobacterium TaxID=28453 RepID=UPI0013DC4E09|nr:MULTISPECIES: alpha/beta hydrolase [unclassified Sphingobacterium]